LIDERNTNLLQDKKGRIWAGGNAAGLSVIDPKRGTIKRLSSKEGLPTDRITNITEGVDGQIWLGSEGGGIMKIDLDGSVYKSLVMKDSIENATWVDRLILDDEGNKLWLASREYGISLIDTEKGTRQRLTNANGLVSDHVSSIAMDENGHIWAITDNGVQSIDPENHKLTAFTRSEGLPANDGFDLISHKNKIFLGTSNGLSILESFDVTNNNKVHWKVKTIGKDQGLAYVDFAQNSLNFDKDGRLWAGAGLNGSESLVVMDEIKEDTRAYTTYITSLNILDQLQVFTDREIIQEKISTIDTLWARAKNVSYVVDKTAKDSSYLSLNDIQWESVQGPYDLPVGLTLPYMQNYLSFSFNGAQFDNPDKIVYRYILEGIDKNWSPISNKTTSENYRDLAPGEYTFKVASKGFNGVWSKPTDLQFTILPPWWHTWWAYTIFVALFLGLGLVILHYRSKWLKKENMILEERVTERTAELNKTIDELENTQSQLIQSEKMASLGELTAGIAHEIQNPMNFINNFAEVSNELLGEMCEELDKGDIEEAKDISKDITQNLEKISHHGKRASSIVRGMLEHSRNSSGQTEMIDINVLADEYLRLAYHGLRAKDKSFNSDFKTDFDDTLPKVSIIPQDLGRVVLNLINNAFYAVTSIPEEDRDDSYSPCVTVSTKNLKDQVLISIKDNGPGIPAEIKDKIFQPFFTTKPTGKGTGLGLSLAYDIVTTGHGGAIELESSPGQGTEFLIYIPFEKGS
jgi:signal transduction histidine kinase